MTRRQYSDDQKKQLIEKFDQARASGMLQREAAKSLGIANENYIRRWRLGFKKPARKKRDTDRTQLLTMPYAEESSDKFIFIVGNRTDVQAALAQLSKI